MESLKGIISSISNYIHQQIVELGMIFMFMFNSIAWAFRPPFRSPVFFKQMEFIANKSVFIIILTSFFTGMVLSFQIYLGFKIINSENLVGPTVGLGIFRELGPVLTGLIVSARAGGAMAARLGTMRVTEQIDAMDVMGVNPRQYLVAPRIISAVIAMPLLTALFDFVALFGSYLLCVYLLDLDSAVFIEKVQFWLNPVHLNEGLFKASVFGLIFGTVCTYKGFNARGGANGVGNATNEGVVTSMVLIIVSDFFLTKLLRIYLAFMGIA